MNSKQSLRENMLSVLMYLFENYMQDDCDIELGREKLVTELYQVGFQQESINKALNWLDGLADQQQLFADNPPKQNSIRVFTPEECSKMDTQCRSQLMQLEQLGILNTITREVVISQIMQLDKPTINIGQVKWVALMVLFNQPDQKHALTCLEHLVLTDSQGSLQ